MTYSLWRNHVRPDEIETVARLDSEIEDQQKIITDLIAQRAVIRHRAASRMQREGKK